MRDSATTTRPCISGCSADHTTQPAHRRECFAADQVGAVRGTVASMSPAYITTSRWQDSTGMSGEVVIYPPQRDRYPTASDDAPLTYIPAAARQLAALLIRAAELAEVTR